MDEAAKFSFFSSIAEYGRSILRLFGSVPFVLLVVSYGPGVATYGIAGTGTGIHYRGVVIRPEICVAIRPELCVVIRPITRKIFVRERLL